VLGAALVWIAVLRLWLSLSTTDAPVAPDATGATSASDTAATPDASVAAPDAGAAPQPATT
jgi:hypothetical protein